MLEVIGQLVPVDDAETSELLEAQRALVRLRQVSKEVQEKGWSFNTETYKTFTPIEAGGLMTVGADVLKFDAENRDIIQRGVKLFDRETNSSAYAGDILDVTIIRLLPFDELPSPAQTYIAVKAARQFQKRFVGSSEIDGFTQDDENDALVTLEQTEAETGDYNYIYGNPQVVRVLRGGR
jgi:hypothetical protein